MPESVVRVTSPSVAVNVPSTTISALLSISVTRTPKPTIEAVFWVSFRLLTADSTDKFCRVISVMALTATSFLAVILALFLILTVAEFFWL